MSDPVLAVDLGGTTLRAALVDTENTADGGRLLARAERPTPAAQGPEAVISALEETARSLPGWTSARVLGAATAGRVHGSPHGSPSGSLVTALNQGTMPGWDAVPLERELERRLDRPVRVLNDADAAALGEARLGAGRGRAALLFVTVSTGVGAGAVLDGRLLQSASGVHADLGFLRGEDGRTVEERAGGRALEGWMRAQGHMGGARELLGLARHDPDAHARVQDAVSALALAIRNARILLGTEDVAVGGSVGLNPDFLALLRARVALEPPLSRVRLHPAQLGADAGLFGAALFARQQVVSSAGDPAAVRPGSA